MIFNQILSLSNISIIQRVLPNTIDVNIVFDGNSLTQGEGAGGVQVYPNKVKNNYATTFKSLEFHSYGIGGQTLSQMMQDRTTQVLPLANSSKTNILFLWEDVNGLFQNNAAGAQAHFDNMKLYAQDAKNAGFQKVVLLTSYYFKKDADSIFRNIVGTDVSYVELAGGTSDILDIYFDLVTNSNISDVPWDYHIDLRNAPNIGGLRNRVKDNNYFTDFIHLTDLGYQRVAEQVILVVNEIMGIS